MCEKWPIIGHEWVVKRLQQQIKQGRLAHAYLFTGPAHIGKRTLGQALAQALLCTAPKPPCGQCRACRLVSQNHHPDMRIVPEEGEMLKVGQVRDIEADIARKPVEGRFKLFLFPNMHMAHPAAANALLKTLEEPPAHAIFVLTAPTQAALLPTIVSRCQVYALRPLAMQTIEEALRQWQIDDARAVEIAHLADGRIGWARRAAQDEWLLAKRRQWGADFIDLIYTRNRWQRLDQAKRLAGNSQEAQETLTAWTTVLRDMLLLHYQMPDTIINTNLLDQLEPLTKALTVMQIRQALARVYTTKSYLEANVNALLALETLHLRLPNVQRTSF